MFREMRRSDRSIKDRERIEKILNEGEYGVLSVVTGEGYGYGIPLSYAFEDNSIFFHAAKTGLKIDSINKNPRVSFTVVGNTEVIPEKFSTRYESVVSFGRASLVSGQEKLTALKLLVEKYSPDYIKEGNDYIESDHGKTVVVKIDIENITGKSRE